MSTQLERLIPVSVAIVCASCTVGPDYHPPAPPAVHSYTPAPIPPKLESTPVAGGESQDLTLGGNVRAQWWTLFKSTELDGLIAASLQNHPSLQAAQAALRQSQENFNAARGQLLAPSVGLGGGASRQRIESYDYGPFTLPPFTYNLYTASLSLSYTLDIFGKERRNLEGLAATVDYQRFRVEATNLALTSNVLITAIAIASANEQITAANDIIEVSKEQLKLVERQFTLGSASKADTLAAAADAAAARALLPPLEQRQLQLQHRLVALTGHFPGEGAPPDLQLTQLTLPPELPVSLPSELVKQRPDIRAQEALLHAANASIGVATADLYPQLDLRALGGYTAQGNSSLFDNVNRTWQVGGNVTAPLFNGGSLRAHRRAAIAAHDEAMALYKETVLDAFVAVADTLTALETDARALKIQYEALHAAQESLNITRRQYQTGTATLSIYLLTRRQYQQARMDYALVLARRHEDTVALFEAMGGGWWNRTERTSAR